MNTKRFIDLISGDAVYELHNSKVHKLTVSNVSVLGKCMTITFNGDTQTRYIANDVAGRSSYYVKDSRYGMFTNLDEARDVQKDVIDFLTEDNNKKIEKLMQEIKEYEQLNRTYIEDMFSFD